MGTHWESRWMWHTYSITFQHQISASLLALSLQRRGIINQVDLEVPLISVGYECNTFVLDQGCRIMKMEKWFHFMLHILKCTENHHTSLAHPLHTHPHLQQDCRPTSCLCGMLLNLDNESMHGNCFQSCMFLVGSGEIYVAFKCSVWWVKANLHIVFY